jgi:hypothetical protein
MIFCNVVVSSSVGTLEAEVTLLLTLLLNLLKCIDYGITRANAARESGVFLILRTVCRCLFNRGWSNYKLVI